MAVTTTGSTVQGLTQGLAQGLVGNVATNINSISDLIVVTGDPDEIVTSVTGSNVAYDVVGKELYMSTVVGGSTWVQLVQ